ncbi:small ribosomal subunit protein bS18m-like [Trichechus inunguis]
MEQDFSSSVAASLVKSENNSFIHLVSQSTNTDGTSSMCPVLFQVLVIQQWAREVEGQVPWRRACSQYKQTSNEDLPIPMENPYKEPLKKCLLCGKRVDYKNVQLLSRFISPFTGCIHGRHITGLCGKKQKEITKVIKRAQIMGFMPVTYKDPAYLKDPKVCTSNIGNKLYKIITNKLILQLKKKSKTLANISALIL